MSDGNVPGGPPRLVSDATLPPYSYVTGRFPHPIRDPCGHSYGHPPQAAAPLDAAHWRSSRVYLWGCDLFNHGYYWEAHETWESLWHACGRTGATADLLKALIKLAAAGVKAREGRAQGVARHAARAAELLTSVRTKCGTPRYLGFDLDRLIATAGRLQRDPVVAREPTAAVEVVFDFRLVPDGSDAV